MKRRLWIVAGIIVVVLIIVGIFVWQRLSAPPTTAARAQTATVTRGTLVATVNAAGNVSALRSTALAFQATGRVAKVNVQVGDAVKKDQVLMQLDTADLDLALRSAQTNLASAQANFDSSQTSLQVSLKNAQNGVTTAQANYDAAVAKNSTNLDTLIMAKISLDKAKRALATAQAAYDPISWRSDAGLTPQAATLASAQADYNSALANYNITAATINDSALKQAQASLDSAKANLDQAQKAMDTSPKIAQATLDNAKISVDTAQRNLAKATLTAPFDGIVSAVNFSTGDTAGSGTAASVVDLTSLQVKVTIAEVDMAKIKVGEPAQMTMDAVPGKNYNAQVVAISPVGTITQGVVNYPVVVSVTNADSAVKPGMTANLAVEVDRRDNVLLLPTRAVRTQGNQKIVTVEYKGQTIQVPIGTGLSNDTMIEITSGLNEGDQVLLNQTTTNTRGGGPGGVFFGGGF